MDASELGRQVAKRRRELGLSQTEFAEKADISRNYLSLIERGEAQNVSTDMLEKMALVLGMNVADLLNPSQVSDVVIHPALREFALREGLSFDVVDRLARLPRRGQEPDTVEKWEKIYKAIKSLIET